MFIRSKGLFKPHRAPKNCWNMVAVDLFVLMPSSKHVVVVQDLAKRFPAATLSKERQSCNCFKSMKRRDSQRYKYRITSRRFMALERRNSQQMIPSTCGMRLLLIPPRILLKRSRDFQARWWKAEKETARRGLNYYKEIPYTASGFSTAAILFREMREG